MEVRFLYLPGSALNCQCQYAMISYHVYSIQFSHCCFLPYFLPLIPGKIMLLSTFPNPLQKEETFLPSGSVHGVRDPLVLPVTNLFLVPNATSNYAYKFMGVTYQVMLLWPSVPIPCLPSFFSHNSISSVKSLHLCKLCNLHHLPCSFPYLSVSRLPEPKGNTNQLIFLCKICRKDCFRMGWPLRGCYPNSSDSWLESVNQKILANGSVNNQTPARVV